MGSPFHQHIFDFTPLLKQARKRVWPAGRGYHLVQLCRKNPHCRMNQVQQGLSRSTGDVNVNVRGRRSRPLEEKFDRTGSHRDGRHERCHSIHVLDIWTGTLFQEEHKVRVAYKVLTGQVVEWSTSCCRQFNARWHRRTEA
jgi:hypothetical protein